MMLIQIDKSTWIFVDKDNTDTVENSGNYNMSVILIEIDVSEIYDTD